MDLLAWTYIVDLLAWTYAAALDRRLHADHAAPGAGAPLSSPWRSAPQRRGGHKRSTPGFHSFAAVVRLLAAHAVRAQEQQGRKSLEHSS